MQPYIPDLPDLTGLAGLFIVLVMFVAIGALVAGRQAPEASLVAGWGLTAIALTVWGVLTPTSMRIPWRGWDWSPSRAWRCRRFGGGMAWVAWRS